MKRNRGYVRVSTMHESQRDSPEHQEAFIREAAKREGIEIDYFYEDRDTATNIVERDDVQRIIEDAKRGEIESIWFASLSRFSRDALDAITLKRVLVNALRVRVVSIEDGYDSSVKDDELLFGIKSVVNQNTSNDISISSRRGLRQSAREGNYIGSIPPLGYKKVVVDDPNTKSGKRRTLEIVEDKAKIVRLIFNLYTNAGMGEKAIVNYLNGDNPDKKKYPSYRGGNWGLSSVQRILQNEIYTGYNVYGRHTTEIAYDDLTNLMNRRRKLVQKPKSKWEKSEKPTHPAIISVEQFEQAQKIRLLRGGGKRGGRRKFVNVFAKFIFCAECGSAMVTMGSKGKYRYLMCSRRRRMGEAGCSNKKWIPYYKMRDEIVGEILRRIKRSLKEFESKGTKELVLGMPQGDLEKERRRLKKRIEENRKLLFEIRRHHMLGEIDRDQYEFEKAQYEKEIAEAEDRISVIEEEEKRSLDVERLIKDAKKALNELTQLKSYEKDIEKTRLLLMQVVKRIEVDKDSQITIMTYI